MPKTYSDMCLFEKEISKFHAMRSSKEMWEIMALSHKRSKEVKRNKLTLL